MCSRNSSCAFRIEKCQHTANQVQAASHQDMHFIWTVFLQLLIGQLVHVFQCIPNRGEYKGWERDGRSDGRAWDRARASLACIFCWLELKILLGKFCIKGKFIHFPRNIFDIKIMSGKSYQRIFCVPVAHHQLLPNIAVFFTALQIRLWVHIHANILSGQNGWRAIESCWAKKSKLEVGIL